MQTCPHQPYYNQPQGLLNPIWLTSLHYAYAYPGPSEPEFSQTHVNYTYDPSPCYPQGHRQYPQAVQDSGSISSYSELHNYHQMSDPFSPGTLYTSSSSDASSPVTPPLFPETHSQVKEEPLEQSGYFGNTSPSSSRSTTPIPQCDLMPPSDLPLRATGAPPEMKKMMGVFRVNPFAYGRSGAISTLYDGPAHPLEQEPEMFEFQIELRDAPTTEPLEDDDLECFSPEPDSVTLRHPYSHVMEEKQASPLSSQQLGDFGHCSPSPQLSYSPSPPFYGDQVASGTQQIGQPFYRRHSLPGPGTSGYTQIHSPIGHMF